MKLLIVIGAAILLIGCEPTEQQKGEAERYDIRTAAMKKATENCLDRKGIPIFSSWDGRLVDCK